MNDSQFHLLAEQLTQDLENIIDNYINEHDVDIDYERNGNILTISFENGSKIILNRQEPLHQVWLATRENGYHFEYHDNNWICNRSGDTFLQIFHHALEKQTRH